MDHAEPFQAFYIQLLCATPPSSTEQCIEPDMCTPVLPTMDHPTSRPPLRPNKPLLWENCYHSSFDRAAIRIPTDYTTKAEADAATSLPIKESMKLRRLMNDDFKRASLARAARDGPPTVEDPPRSDDPNPSSSVDTHSMAAHSGDDGRSANAHSAISGEDDESESPEDLAIFFIALQNYHRPSNTMATVEMTYDLTEANGFSDPMYFFFRERDYLIK